MKREYFIYIFLALIVSFSFIGCDFIYGLLQRAGAEEKAILGEIIPFADNEKVLETQELLKIYGFKPGKIDGRMGQKTRDALEEFQKKNNLKPTRFVDKKTWARLNLIKEAGLVANGEINIETVQAILLEAGFDPGKIDGKMGPKTKIALKEFQEANGLKSDGKIGQRTFEKLIEYLPAR